MENQTNNGQKIAESQIFKNILSKAEDYLRKPLRVKQLLNDAYKKASEKKDVGTIAHEVWESLQTLSRMIKAAVSGEYTGIPTSTLVGGVAIILYFLSPIDFVPDFIPVIGLLDDAALLAWFMTSIKGEMEKFEQWENSNQAGVAVRSVQGGHQPVDNSANTPKYPNPASNVTTSGPAANSFSPSAEPTGSNQTPNPTTETAHQSSGTANPNTWNPSAQRRNEDGTPKNDDLKQQVKEFTPHDLPTESNTPDDSAIRATSTGSGEPNVRTATTDSTRIPSSNDNDRTAGGNVR